MTFLVWLFLSGFAIGMLGICMMSVAVLAWIGLWLFGSLA